MGFLDKVKASAERAATKAKEGVADVQAKRELGQAYGELGRKAFDLAERGELAHAELTPTVERIRALKEAEASAEEPSASAGAASSGESGSAPGGGTGSAAGGTTTPSEEGSAERPATGS